MNRYCVNGCLIQPHESCWQDRDGRKICNQCEQATSAQVAKMRVPKAPHLQTANA